MNKKLYIPILLVIFTAIFLYGFAYVTDAIGSVKVPIICYHHLDLDDYGNNNAVITPEKFKEDMIALKEAGFTGILFEDLIDYVENGNPMPEKPVLITFDDGYYSNYQYAYPILRELNIKATISVIGKSVGKNIDEDTGNVILPHFGWNEAREMYQSGLVDIQSHSFDMHGSGTDNSSDRKGVLQIDSESDAAYSTAFMKDCLIEKELIETNVGNKVFVFTYPYGEYSATSEKVLKQLGYKVSLVLGDNISQINRKGDSLYKLKRIIVSQNMSSSELIERLSK